MMGKTHAAAGLYAGILLAAANPDINPITAVVTVTASVAGAMLPDIDHYNSTISNHVKPLAAIIRLVFGKRKLIHDPAFYGILYLALSTWNPSLRYFLTPLFFGVLTHLGLDALTPDGIQFCLFYRIRIPLVRTNSLLDKGIGAVCMALSAITVGYIGFSSILSVAENILAL